MAANYLDDYLESIAHLPEHIRGRLEALQQKDKEFEEGRKALFKKRNLYLRADEKGLDAQLQTALLRRIDKEHAKLAALIRQKALEERRLQQILDKHLERLEREMLSKRLATTDQLVNPYKMLLQEIPTPSSAADTFSRSFAAAADVGYMPRINQNKRRNTLDASEAIDPNEPVYCSCRQVSYGDMIACDNPSCSVEWFHYACVGLDGPPRGRWFCPRCRPTESADDHQAIGALVDDKMDDFDDSE